MEAIVLAGGFGTRLQHIVSDVPKPMAPVCGNPFLRYIFNDLIEKGVDRLILAVGYKHQIIQDYFGASYRGVPIQYSVEDQPLYTGGAIKKALKLCREKDVFVINGDTFFDVNLRKMLEDKIRISCACLVAAKEMLHFDRYGALLMDGKRIAAFKEKKPTDIGFINGGVYCIDRSLLDAFEKQKFSFESDILEPGAKDGKIYAFSSEGYFIDIGIPADYEKAQEDFIEKNVQNKAAFFDRDGTINVEINYLHKCKDLRFVEGMPQFIKKWNDWGFKVIVVTNQAGIARGIYTEKEMHALHQYMNEQLKLWGAHVDAFYFCPHHPDYSGACHCRKPEPGMLEAAIREFNLATDQCILFGDQPWDIAAGERCCVKGYMVE